MISIIIPNYNNGKYLNECLYSIINQAYNDYEIIFIDDGSTDDSIEIAEKFKEKYNVKKMIIISQFNQNASVARNKGLEIAKGEYVLFLDSDDRLHDEKTLEKILINIDNYDLLIGNYEIINDSGKKINAYIMSDKNIFDIDNPFKYALLSPVPSNKLYKSELIRKYNLYFANVRIGQDLNFYLKYLSICKNVKIVNDFIYDYRIVMTGISRTINFNILDIYNSINDVKKFMEVNYCEELLKKCIPIVELEHYNFQISKLCKINSKKIRKAFFQYFDAIISEIDSSFVYDNIYWKEEYKIYMKKKMFSLIYLSNIYNKIVKLKEIKNDGEKREK